MPAGKDGHLVGLFEVIKAAQARLDHHGGGAPRLPTPSSCQGGVIEIVAGTETKTTINSLLAGCGPVSSREQGKGPPTLQEVLSVQSG